MPLAHARSALLLVGLLFAALLAGCGGGGSSTSSTTAEASGSTAAEGEGGAASPAWLKEAEAQVAIAYKGTNTHPPTSGPAAVPGKDIWIISCGQSQESCSGPVGSAQEAAEGIGWKVTVFDGKFDPSQYSQGIRDAIAANADGILLQAIDCPLVKRPLEEAKSAGIPVVALQAADCNDVEPGAPKLFTAPIHYGTGIENYAAYVRAWAAVKADWIIDRSEGKAVVLNFAEEDLPTTALINAGFTEEMKKCTTCEVIDVKFAATDLGPKLQEKAQQALLKYPNATYVHAPYDSTVTAGIGPAVVASGRAGDIEVMGGEGYPPNIELIREGEQQNAANGFIELWTGYAGVDTLNRLFAGAKLVPQGIGWQLIDAEHNLPASGPYTGGIDFAPAYEKIWSGS
jgi:ribose transport system substrate-binding protein